MAAGAAPLLYYAVWLPAPAGQMAGPPIYVPAASGGLVPPAMPPFPAAPQAAPPATPPATGAPAGPTLSPAAEAAAHNQRLLVAGIIFFVFLVHLPWLVYLVGVHGCWGSFLENCFAPPDEADVFAELAAQPMLFAQVTFLMLRVQSVLAGDWAQFSQAMQISTGIGSFVLTKIVAANGLIAEGRLRVWLLAATCALAFAVLFWAELHLGSLTRYPELGDETVLSYIDQNLPADFIAFASVESSLTEYLQFLRLADALILGAALAMPTTQRSRP